MSFRIAEGAEKFTIIGDLNGYGYRNSDLRGYLAALSILQVRSLDTVIYVYKDT